MARVKVPYLVSRANGDGAVRYYWSPKASLIAAGFRRQRLSDIEGEAIALARALNAELDAQRKGPLARPAATAPDTVGQVIRDYKTSRAFTALRASTQRVYKQDLARIEEWAGDKAIGTLTRAMWQDLYDKLAASRPTLAVKTITMGSILYRHARLSDKHLVNHAAGVDVVEPVPIGGIIWPAPAVAAFVATADALGFHGVATAVAVNDWCGQREGDILAITRARLGPDLDRLMYRQRKGGRGVVLPLELIAPLMARIRAEIARQDQGKVLSIDARSRPLVVNRSGDPYLPGQFNKDFATVRAALALKTKSWEVDYLPADSDDPVVATADLQFMHLRHTAVVRLAEAGVDVPSIAAITGHSLKTVTMILERYLIRTATMAKNAFTLRLAKEGGQ